MKKVFMKSIALGMAAMMMVGLVGCSKTSDDTNTTNSTNASTQTPTGTVSTDSIEPVQIQALIGPTTLSGVQGGQIFTDVFEKQFGLTVDFLFAGDNFDERLSTLLATDSLPDLVCFKNKTQLENAVKVGAVMPLDDLVAQYGQDIQKNLPDMLKYMRENYSDGTGKLYGLASQVGNNTPTNSLHFVLYVRSDIYKAIGSPEANTYDDILNILKQMQDKYPQNENGQKVYALQLWSDWDSMSMSLDDFTIPQYKGINPNTGTLFFTEYDSATKTLKNIFDADSEYFKGVEFYHKAYQMGILDPDSITQTWPNAQTKTQNAQVLTTMWAWQSDIFNGCDYTKAKPEAGMIPIFAKQESKCNLQADAAVGRDYIYAIGKNAKNPDRIMKLLNYCSTLEGSYTMMNGVKGSTWDIVDGKAQFKTDFLSKVISGDASIAGSYYNEAFTMLNKWNIDPNTNESISFEGWSQVIQSRQTTAEKEWATANNCINVYDYATKNLTVVKDDGVTSLAGPPSDDVKVIQQKLGELLKTQSWKMVYSESDDEYNKLKQELIEKAKAVGSDINFEWAQQEVTAAQQKSSEYTEYHLN